jgi:hypothetical protein
MAPHTESEGNSTQEEWLDYRYFRDKISPWIKFHPLTHSPPFSAVILDQSVAEQRQASCFSRFRIHPVLDNVWHNPPSNTFRLHIYLHSNICTAQPRCSTIFTLQDSNLFAAVSEALFLAAPPLRWYLAQSLLELALRFQQLIQMVLPQLQAPPEGTNIDRTLKTSSAATRSAITGLTFTPSWPCCARTFAE